MQSTHGDLLAGALAFNRWAKQRRACPTLSLDAAKAASLVIAATRSESPEKPAGPRRGRPALSTENPVAHLMPLLSLERPRWLDDIVYGSTATAAGANKGKLNVRPGHVLAALHGKTISVETLRGAEYSERSRRAVAQAARHAAKGIAHYLDRHPHIEAHIEARLKAEADILPDHWIVNYGRE